MPKEMQNGQQMRYTDEELGMIKNTFKGNEKLLKLLRKVFLPELDPDAPIGQVIDLWMTVKIDDLTPEQALINIKARNTLITHIDQQLYGLKILADSDDLTAEEMIEKVKKNSAK